MKENNKIKVGALEGLKIFCHELRGVINSALYRRVPKSISFMRRDT